MGVLYRILGVAALIGQRLSRARINFIPLNWAAMIGLFVACGVALQGASEGFHNGASPKRASVADIVDRKIDLAQNYVRVTGMLAPEMTITATYQSKYESEKEAESKPPTQAWVPLIAPSGSAVLLVELEDPDSAGSGKPRATTITGMLEPMDTDLRTEIEKDTGDRREWALP
jgi:hypothetical protein